MVEKRVVAGGVAGLALAAGLESENGNDCDYEDIQSRRRTSKVNGMELLVEKVRREAKWAMEECTTDEELEKVYEDVSTSIRKLPKPLCRIGARKLSSN